MIIPVKFQHNMDSSVVAPVREPMKRRVLHFGRLNVGVGAGLNEQLSQIAARRLRALLVGQVR